MSIRSRANGKLCGNTVVTSTYVILQTYLTGCPYRNNIIQPSHPATSTAFTRDLVIFNTTFVLVARGWPESSGLTGLNSTLLLPGPFLSQVLPSPILSLSRGKPPPFHHFHHLPLTLSSPHCRLISPSDELKGHRSRLPLFPRPLHSLPDSSPTAPSLSKSSRSPRTRSALAPQPTTHPSLSSPHHRHNHHRGPNPQSAHL
jgi:hypothetical protein